LELAKLTSKGQITIPKQIRKVLEVQEGDRLAFIEEDGLVIMTKANLQQLNDLQNILSDDKFKSIIQNAKSHFEIKE
jgi:antitoxin PrlF